MTGIEQPWSPSLWIAGWQGPGKAAPARNEILRKRKEERERGVDSNILITLKIKPLYPPSQVERRVKHGEAGRLPSGGVDGAQHQSQKTVSALDAISPHGDLAAAGSSGKYQAWEHANPKSAA